MTIEERDRLKNDIIGFPAAVTDVSKEFNDDMDKYAGAFPKEKRMYRTALAEVAKTLKAKSDQLASVQADLQKLKDEYKAREASKDPQIKQHEDINLPARARLRRRARQARGRTRPVEKGRCGGRG